MKYLDIKDTPLRFHRIYSRWVLPLDSFLNLVSFFTLLQVITKEGGSWQDYASLALVVVFITLCFAAFRGLMYFRKSGYIAAVALLLIQIGDNLYRAYVYLKAGPQYMLVAALLSVVALGAILIYYLKRRKLFTTEGISLEELMALHGVKVNQNTAFQTRYGEAGTFCEENRQEMSEEEEEEEIGEYDCPRCGFHITDGAVFCPKCGAQTRVVRR